LVKEAEREALVTIERVLTHFVLGSTHVFYEKPIIIYSSLRRLR